MANWSKKVVLETLVKEGVISLGRGRVISSIDLAKNPGNYPVYSSSAQRNGMFGAYSLYDFDEELITWSVDGGGHFFHRPKHKFSVTNVAGTLRIVDAKKYDYKFLYYLLAFQHSNQLFNYVDKAHPSVIKKRYFIPVIEVVEQRQVARVLSKVDEAISQTEQLIAKYRRLKTGLMQDLLTKGIDAHGNIRSEETHAFKDSPLGRIPAEWDMVKLSAISEISSGVTLGKEYPISGTKELPYLRVANVQDGYLDLSEIKYFRLPVAQIPRYKLEVGDVLMNEGGDFDKLGRGTVWQGQIPDCLHQNHVFRVRLNQQEMLPDFLSVYSASNYGKSFFLVSAKQSTNLASINKSQLNVFPILKPALDEQHRILNSIRNHSSMLELTQDNLAKLQSLKTGLMQDILSGKVRVGQLIRETAAA
jgi:type I restriction enzyme S subunit